MLRLFGVLLRASESSLQSGRSLCLACLLPSGLSGLPATTASTQACCRPSRAPSPQYKAKGFTLVDPPEGMAAPATDEPPGLLGDE